MTFENAFLGEYHNNTYIDRASSILSSGRFQVSLFSPDYIETYQEDKEGNSSSFLERLQEAWTTIITPNPGKESLVVNVYYFLQLVDKFQVNCETKLYFITFYIYNDLLCLL